jgi:xylulokinase
MSLLGIDIGTSGCKAATFSTEGTQLAFAHREYPTAQTANGQAELDSALILARVAECIREVAAGCGKDPVRALCVSSMGEAAVPVARKAGILGNSILSMDMRGGEYIEHLAAKMDDREFFAINANIRSPAYTFPKLAWIRDHQPEQYAKAEHFVLWDGLLGYLCGCEPFVSYASASRTLLFDLRKQTWSQELLDIAGIAADKLPRCLPSGSLAGEVSAKAAADLGLPRGVAVVVGAHDQCCNALGAGITRPGRAVDGIGTFECITPVYDHIPPPEQMLSCGLNVEHHAVPGLYVSFIFNQAGSLVRWFRHTFAAAETDEDIYGKLTAEMPANPTSLLVLPYFEPTGAPWYVADGSGVIVGLKTSTTRGEILKAIMEGATFYFAQCVDRIRPLGIDSAAFIATGGGAKSDAWLQMKADIMGVPYLRPRVSEAGLVGAAILAGIGIGEVPSFDEGAERFVSIDRDFEPDLRRHALYRERLGRYAELLRLMTPWPTP